MNIGLWVCGGSFGHLIGLPTMTASCLEARIVQNASIVIREKPVTSSSTAIVALKDLSDDLPGATTSSSEFSFRRGCRRRLGFRMRSNFDPSNSLLHEYHFNAAVPAEISAVYACLKTYSDVQAHHQHWLICPVPVLSGIRTSNTSPSISTRRAWLTNLADVRTGWEGDDNGA
jgi:hypothetical protein